MSKVVFEITGMRYHVEQYDGVFWTVTSLRPTLEQAVEEAKESCAMTGLAHRVVDTWEGDND